MKESAIAKLREEYSKIESPNFKTSIKYYFKYNNINVNIYYDCFDKYNPSLILILHNFNDYYVKSLNIINDDSNKEYLEKISRNILSHLLKEKKLDDFFEAVYRHIIEDRVYIINDLSNDNTYKKSFCVNKNKIDNIYIQGLRKVPMSEEQYNYLRQSFNIEEKTLNKIRDKGFTVVTTNDITKKKALYICLKSYNLY